MKEYLCFVCNQPIVKERVEFLIESGKREHDFTCVNHSTTKRVKGLYSGENGTSDIIFCDKIYDDNVRAVFIDPEEKHEEPKVDSSEL